MKNSKEYVITAFNSIVQEDAKNAEDAMKPFRVLYNLFSPFTRQILMELLEKPEIGPHIISDVLTLVLHSLQKYKEGFSFSREIVSTLTSLLDDLKPEIVWKFLCDYLEASVTSTPRKSSPQLNST